MTDDLVTWLRAQLDEDEARTRKLLVYAQQTVLTLQDPSHLGKFIPGWHDWLDVETMCTVRLAEVAAKRAIIDLHSRVDSRTDWLGKGDVHWPPESACYGCGANFREEYAVPDANDCPVVRLLAQPYADRPGYRDEWRP
jgi:Family of unknown function (DUF6221)